MLAFIRNLVGAKADSAVQAGVEALVRWDPESASEAELRTMEQHLDELGRQVAEARQAYDRERREAEATTLTCSASPPACLTRAHLRQEIRLEAVYHAPLARAAILHRGDGLPRRRPTPIVDP